MTSPLYRPVDAQVAWPEMETAILSEWARTGVFARSMALREGRPEWVFYEGPPTANGKPGLHHVEPRAFKDIFCRFKTMQGFYVHRRGGWDCHGLPVEIEVEKELGIKQKKEIEERIGIDAFVQRCRESVQRYVDQHRRLSERIGFWQDLDDAYWTMTPDYIESVWWLLKVIWDKGLLTEDFKVVPYCPRCETSLSSHEQHQTDAYKTVEDPSVYVRFPLVDEPSVSLLVWTTTPWTLLANMAAAVGSEVDYVRVKDPEGPGELILAEALTEAIFESPPEVIEHLRGDALVGKRYDPPFAFVDQTDTGHRVLHADFVNTEEGTGIVHLAPYGEDDMTVAKAVGLPVVQMIDARGRVVDSGGGFAGAWIKDADPLIVADLRKRDRLFRVETYSHAYPHCWRCSTPLLYYPRLDWYIRTSQIRADLQASNEATNWQPPTIKHGRFGDWLANNVDWSLSRDRYWGTPLPIWRCDEGHAVCVGSFAELSELAKRDLSDLDPHRPWVDEVAFDCPECGNESRRVSAVIDGWFDSGAMPFAQWHYPFENEDVFERRFPADFISEAIDQTRGWFYSLLAVATLARGHNSYKNVVCLGHIVDADGRKMSKSLGNVIEPASVLDVHGADAIRWYLLTGGTPWSPRRVSPEIIQEVLRKFLLTVWNTYSFWVTYASIEDFDPTQAPVPVEKRPEIDRWILAELNDTIAVVTTGLEAFDTTAGGRRLDSFVDDLSNWYVRRSRRRFWRSGQDDDTRAAFQTLWECLVTLTKLLAPFTPFVAEEIYTNLTAPLNDAPASVHHADWPQPDEAHADDELRARMKLSRRLATLGRSARTEAAIRTRQPLARALVVLPTADAARLTGLHDILAEELNVKGVEVATGLQDLVTYSVRPNFKTLGPRFGARVKAVAGALAAADPEALVRALEKGSAPLEVEGEQISLAAGDVEVRVAGRTGLALVQDGPYGVALDLELTDELRAEGIARETIRGIQDLRKDAGLAVQDRITLWLWSAQEAVHAALSEHSDRIAAEVLAQDVHHDQGSGSAASGTVATPEGTAQFALKPTD